MSGHNNSTYKQSSPSVTAGQKAAPEIVTNPQTLMQLLLNLYTSLFKEKLPDKMLIALFIVLPWNLSKHFDRISSTVGSFVIPYLVPALYLQDIFCAVLVLLGLPSLLRGMLRPVAAVRISARLFFLFILAVFLSTFYAGRFYPSAYFFARLLLCFLVFVAVGHLFCKPRIRRWFYTALLVNIFLLSILGLFQFSRQASLFTNYLFFGEQPYTIYTPYIAKESFNGVAKIPPYATFQHPNIFAGYLAVSLTLLIGYGLRRGKRWLVLSSPAVLLGFVALLLTRSYTAWAAVALGLPLLLCVRLVFASRAKFARFAAAVFLCLTCAAMLLGLLFPLYKDSSALLLDAGATTSTLSVERRVALLDAAYKMIVRKPFFGWGINSFTYSFEPFYSRLDPVRFLQPVHNVFALLAVEVGIIGAAWFVLVLLHAVYSVAHNGGWLYNVVLLQIVFLSSFDHYFITMPQTQLLCILTLLLGLTYTKDVDCL